MINIEDYNIIIKLLDLINSSFDIDIKGKNNVVYYCKSNLLELNENFETILI